MVALHLDNSTAKAYVCNQDGTSCLFLSRLACYILNLVDKHGISLIGYMPIHANVETDSLSWGRLVPEWHLLPNMSQATFQLWGQLATDLLAFSYTNQCQHYYTLENPLPLGAMALSASNHP